MKKILKYFGVFIIFIFMILIILNPKNSAQGAVNGLLLCGNVIIPSRFPFAVCISFLMNSGIVLVLKPFNRIFIKIFGMNFEMFSLFLLSFLGGYPIGAKLLNDSVKNKKITQDNARVILNFCINAGPGFIILAVGIGVLNNRLLGVILFFSNIFSSILIVLFLKKKLKLQDKASDKTASLNFAENFVTSTTESAKAIFTICSFVILFSTISSLLENLKFITPFFEVTNAIYITKNIYFLSFLIGFAGISIWFQIFNICKNFKISYFSFIFFRILHGFLSSFITYFLIKIFKISVTVFSNNIDFSFSPYNIGLSATFSLIIMGIIFIISLNNEKKGGNILKDLV